MKGSLFMNNGRMVEAVRARTSGFVVALLVVALMSGPAGYAQSLERARPEAVGLSS